MRVVKIDARLIELLDLKVTKRAIDHSQSQLERVLDSLEFLVFFTEL
jgi:hypothetical protein